MKIIKDRIIWTYGWGANETMPPYIEACHYTMKTNSECEVIVVTPDDISKYIKNLPKTFFYLKPPHQADIFRTNILYQFGGMYLDGDTVVMRSLKPLFDMLSSFDLIGMSWKPHQLPKTEWQGLGVSVMGPMKPHLPFLRQVIRKQQNILQNKLPILAFSKIIRVFPNYYPFKWEELLSPIVNTCFENIPPKALIGDGASTWFSLVGGPSWFGGVLKNPLRPLSEVETLPDSELFTLANSILPVNVKNASLESILSENTILAHLLMKALKINEPKEIQNLRF